MARWRLTDKAYLNVPGTEWEYNSTTAQGKSHRERYPVPLYLDPEDRSFHNRDGEVILAYEGSAQKGDIVFIGPPVGEMDPLDDEAVKLSAAVASRGEHPIESLPANFDAIPKPVPTSSARRA